MNNSDIYDNNKKTGALILGTNRLDDYAAKYLSKRCPQALREPMPLPVDEILKAEGLTVVEQSLSDMLDIFGCCFLCNGQVEILDCATGERKLQSYAKGTILIDPNSAAVCGEGARRNTLMHEAVHWEKDRCYFEILEATQDDDAEPIKPIMCRQSKTFYTPSNSKSRKSQIEWLEWQAHRLAPRILMPRDPFKKKAVELLKKYSENGESCIPSCQTLVEDLSEFFIVSKSSVKYRLREVGLQDAVAAMHDYDDVFAEIDKRSQNIALKPVEAWELLRNNIFLQKLVANKQFTFVDGYFVLTNPQYIVCQDGELHLTAKAKKNLSKCAVNICEQQTSDYKFTDSDVFSYSALFKTGKVHPSILIAHPKFQPDFDCEPIEAYAAAYQKIISDADFEPELEAMLGNPQKTLCECLWFLMQKRKWFRPKKFADETLLHENYHGKIKNNKYNNMGKATLMAICVGLRLTWRFVEKFFEKSENKLKSQSEPDKTYIHILNNIPKLSIYEFNGILKAAGQPMLGLVKDDNEIYSQST